MFLLCGTFLISKVKTTLTENGIVTASSVNPDTSSGLDGVIDGIFATKMFSGKKCLSTNNHPSKNEWFNI